MALRNRKKTRLPLYLAGAGLVAALIGLWWLGQQAGGAPPKGEIRIPVEGKL